MVARNLFVLFVVTIFSLGLANVGLSAGMGDEAKGTVTKIEGGKVTIKEFMGDEKTVEPKNPEALTNLKVGDKADVKDGILTNDGTERFIRACGEDQGQNQGDEHEAPAAYLARLFPLQVDDGLGGNGIVVLRCFR